MYCKVWTRKLLEREGPVSEAGGVQEEALVAGQGQYAPLSVPHSAKDHKKLPLCSSHPVWEEATDGLFLQARWGKLR